MTKKGGLGVIFLAIMIILLVFFSALFFFNKIPGFLKKNVNVDSILTNKEAKMNKTSEFNLTNELNSAEKLLSNGNYKVAAQMYKTIIYKEPKNYLANIGLAEAYIKLGRLEESFGIINKTLNNGNFDYRLYIALGNYYFDIGDYIKYFHYLNLSYSLNPNSNSTIKAMLDFSNTIGNYDGTLEIANISLKKIGKTANAYRRISIAYFFKGDLNNALIAAKTADSIVANYSKNQILVGLIYLALNNTKNAIEEFQKVDVHGRSEAIEGISLAYKLEDDEKNYENYKSAAELYKKDAFSRTMLGYAMLRLNHYDLSIIEFNVSISEDPSYYAAYKGMGEAFLKKGQNEKAAYYLDKASELMNKGK